MRLVFALYIVTLIEAKKKRPKPIENENEKSKFENVDVYPVHFQHPVPFGHIYKDGFGDPRSELKQPFDLLELDMVRPKNAEQAKEIWEKRQKRIQLIPKNIPTRFASPRDQYWHELQHQNDTDVNRPPERRNESRPWIDWEAIQDYNVGQPRPLFKRPQPKERPIPTHDIGNKKQYFAPSSFDLTSNKMKEFNWTSCDEFGKMPHFHPKDVVNVDWVPFFVWSTMSFREAVVHRFSYPTKKLVKEYKDDYSAHVNKSIDWDQPKLVLKEAIEMLLIAKDRTGMFHTIPHIDIPSHIKNKPVEFPTLTIRLKIEDPYLALMHCENQFAVIMAVAGNEPTTGTEKKSEAATLKFRGIGFPVARDFEAERIRAKAQRDWEVKRKEDAMINVDEPVVRDHFLGRDTME